jgi:hypothetical protein
MTDESIAIFVYLLAQKQIPDLEYDAFLEAALVAIEEADDHEMWNDQQMADKAVAVLKREAKNG